MEEFDKLVQDKNKLLVIAGIMHSARAFVGPEVLHIDLTNWCNFNCIACWCRSPLLKDKAMPDWEKKLIIPFDVIKKVFDDLEQMGGLRQVKLVGGGEPFMHPDILNIVKYIKGKDKTIEIDINTNFSLVTEQMAQELLEVGLDSFTVSLWAGTAQVYAAVHPNQDERTFEKIEKVLRFISAKKKERAWFHPRIIIHDVVFNRNYRDVEEMVKFALTVGASDIQFVPIDTVKDRTEELLLDDKERLELLEALQRIRKNYNPQSFDYTSGDGRVVKLPDFDGFIRRIERLNLASGAYDEDVVDEVPCYAGWLFARIMTTGSVVPCCKGHRMSMGNIYKNSFKDIWLSDTYNEFRKNCLKLPKSDPYFLKIGNDAAAKTGCYNCDNLWQNIPTHKKITSLKSKNNQLVSFCSNVLKNIF
jgi:MoaA/NifB/PqqE/SkfB family radical SAM enzyme